MALSIKIIGVSNIMVGLLTIILLSMICTLCEAQTETIVKLETETGTIEGALLVPGGKEKGPCALIVAGSGPVDRDGNLPGMTNNSLKMLGTELLKNGITTLRYDKRGVGKSKDAGSKEENLRFEHYIADVEDWIRVLASDDRFSNIFVIGHSEGSLLGMIASQGKNVDGFISISGLGQSADELLKKQLKSQSPEVLKISLPIIDQLSRGRTVSDVNPALFALFRPSVQPYFISWFKYSPCHEIAKLSIPILIVQGATDIQVGEADAARLAEANPKAKMKMIKGMNHILKDADNDRMKNLQTYNQPDLPIKRELVEVIVGFVRSV